MESVFEDVGRNLKEALSMIKGDVERFGIDITNIEDIKEPPEPESFPLYKEVKKWEKEKLNSISLNLLTLEKKITKI